MAARLAEYTYAHDNNNNNIISTSTTHTEYTYAHDNNNNIIISTSTTHTQKCVSQVQASMFMNRSLFLSPW